MNTLTAAELKLKEAVMQAIEEAVFAGVPPENVNEVLLFLVGAPTSYPAWVKSMRPMPKHSTRPPQTTTCGQCNTDCVIPAPKGWICSCGQTTIVSKEYLANNLSGQARWYLGGSFPVYDRATPDPMRKGRPTRPEPTALNELVNAGLAFYEFIPGMGHAWLLSEPGKKKQQELKTGK
jgi:hypothetical protein